LTRLVGLQNSVRVIEGNVLKVPVPDATVDVVISQEALSALGLGCLKMRQRATTIK
jgi:hypothetical protein